MRNSGRRIALLLAGIALLLLTAAEAAATGWHQIENPAAAGWSAEKLAAAKKLAEEGKSASVMIVEHGRVVAAWGQVDRPMPLYSMRKGLYNALVGMLVQDGKLQLDATLRGLGIDEVDGLSDVERTATVAQLLVARSGVYHPSAYEPSSMKRNRPQRGSARPGQQWFYNNWDFNVLAHLIEQASGRDLADLFRGRLAEPLGMEDFSLDDAFSFLEPSRSRYPAVIFRMSARDLARFGQLYLQKGTWQGKRLLDEAWIHESWTPHTTFEAGSPWGAGDAFGYLWWIYPRGDARNTFAGHDVFLTRGAEGQVVAVVPDMDLVAVHQTDTENGHGGSFEGAVRVIDAVIAAKTTDAAASPKTVALHPQPLPNARPAPPRGKAIAWTQKAIDGLLGEYALNPKTSFVVHQVDGRLFALPKGIPLAEVELFIDASGTIFSPAVDLTLDIVRADDGRITALKGTMEGRPVAIQRIAGGSSSQ